MKGREQENGIKRKAGRIKIAMPSDEKNDGEDEE